MIAQVLDVVPVLDEVPACELLRLADFLRGEACHRLSATSLLRGLRTGGSLRLCLQPCRLGGLAFPLRSRSTLLFSGREALLQCSHEAPAIGLEALGPEAYRIAAGERPDRLRQAVGARHGSPADQHRN
jgi:hypothetical protein